MMFLRIWPASVGPAMGLYMELPGLVVPAFRRGLLNRFCSGSSVTQERSEPPGGEPSSGSLLWWAYAHTARRSRSVTCAQDGFELTSECSENLGD